ASILFSIIQNIGMTIGLLPISGITLPFVSYGGSSMLTYFISLGLALNIGMRKNKINF
ncbi:MAG: FtsW/RodA/SpoVE family cell cycle protein, partial [Clostridium sporogenes]|nr:FtsW/RodA/SpoVE family cell cycle protein [Clostridium sporogenes]